MNVGGIVLCGGRSSRMGTAKATLPFGPELMLPRVVRLLSAEVQPIVVVAAAEQSLPELPAHVIMARDGTADRGPLEGLRVGLQALAGRADAAYASSCDVPLLAPPFVRRMIDSLGTHQIAVPQEARFSHPLAAVYRTGLVAEIQGLLDRNRSRPAFLFDAVRTHRVAVETLRDVDPDLDTLLNLNTPSDYIAALAKAGFSANAEILRQFGL